MALKHLGDVPLHLSFDVDALDPSVAPATVLFYFYRRELLLIINGSLLEVV